MAISCRKILILRHDICHFYLPLTGRILLCIIKESVKCNVQNNAVIINTLNTNCHMLL